MGGPSILTSLLPVFLIIICGYIFKKTKFPGDDFWPGTEKIVYYFLYPALLFSSSAGASWEFFSVASMVWAILGAMFVMSGILLLLRPRLTRNDASFTSVFQGSLRFTSYIGFAAAFSLFGDEGLYLAAVFITVMIPMVNILCVMVLVRYGGQKSGWYWIPPDHCLSCRHGLQSSWPAAACHAAKFYHYTRQGIPAAGSACSGCLFAGILHPEGRQ
ncbi:MAG: hypothetical protein AMK70_09645 [Nitrospira bacterium SG8_35_1]|nr:MAG: hypothetical protein AMK70_09645 [Nitrospira bacterium SG8_35_1]